MDTNNTSEVLVGNQAMRDFLDKLSSTNVSKYIQVPQLAVFGDTSSGKSSLLSAIAQVELPANSSLTTRCPTMLQIRRAENREARIAVQWKSSFPSTTTLPPEFEERVVTEDSWSSIPIYIQEAQAHILEHTGKSVTPDIVSVQVSGPQGLEQQPMTLMDLPGWVQSRGQDDAVDLIPEIQKLLEEYMKNPRCVILAVLPANVDYHNSTILGLAQKVDPKGLRTIPVITKPDLIDKGAEQDVLELLLGNKIKLATNNGDNNNNPLVGGFHMCKGRSQAALDRNQTIVESLTDEINFFESTEPWKSVENREMFGMEALRRKLGAIMMKQIKDTMPTVMEEIRANQRACEAKLSQMGRSAILTTVDRRLYYQDVCTKLVEQLKSSLSGKGQSRTSSRSTKNSRTTKTTPTAAPKLHAACSEFMDKIRQSSLNTIMQIVEGAHVLVTTPKGDVSGEVVHLDKDFACVDYTDEDADNVEYLFEHRAYKAQQQLEVDDVWSDGTNIFIARSDSMFDSLRRIPLDKIRTDPSWLREKIAENRTDDLACFLNADIFNNIVEGFVEDDWRPLCTSLLDSTKEILLTTIADTVEANLPTGNLRYLRLRSFIEKQCRAVADELMKQAINQVEMHLQHEKFPYSQDQILFDSIAAARHKSLRRELEAALKLDQPKQAVYDSEALRVIMDEVFERNQRKSVEDQMAEEFEIVLEAYGQVATRRQDRVPMACWEVFRTLPSAIQDSLLSATDEMLQNCMTESMEFLKAHRSLREELDEMTKALQVLESVL